LLLQVATSLEVLDNYGANIFLFFEIKMHQGNKIILFW